MAYVPKSKRKTWKELDTLRKKMLGKKMTKEQLKFQEELRQKVKNREITMEEAHRIWRKKYSED